MLSFISREKEVIHLLISNRSCCEILNDGGSHKHIYCTDLCRVGSDVGQVCGSLLC